MKKKKLIAALQEIVDYKHLSGSRGTIAQNLRDIARTALKEVNKGTEAPQIKVEVNYKSFIGCSVSWINQRLKDKPEKVGTVIVHIPAGNDIPYELAINWFPFLGVFRIERLILPHTEDRLIVLRRFETFARFVCLDAKDFQLLPSFPTLKS